jgi:siderophore synthetase component
MNKLKEGLVELAKLDQAEAVLKYGPFNSEHEAYAVLKEELEEMDEAATQVLEIFSLIWGNIKRECLAPDDLKALHANILHMGAEMVQCLGVVQKWTVLYEDPRVDSGENGCTE